MPSTDARGPSEPAVLAGSGVSLPTPPTPNAPSTACSPTTYQRPEIHGPYVTKFFILVAARTELGGKRVIWSATRISSGGRVAVSRMIAGADEQPPDRSRRYPF